MFNKVDSSFYQLIIDSPFEMVCPVCKNNTFFEIEYNIVDDIRMRQYEFTCEYCHTRILTYGSIYLLSNLEQIKNGILTLREYCFYNNMDKDYLDSIVEIENYLLEYRKASV